MGTLVHVFAAVFYVVGTTYYAVALWLMLDDRRKNRLWRKLERCSANA